jgi:uncharacterized membrane protein YccC
MVDALALWLFGDGASSLFAAYAVVTLLYFCDFDGDLADRALSFSIAALLGLGGVALGVVLAPSLLGSLVVMGGLALLLSMLHSLFGNVAIGAIGLQLGVLLAVLTPATPGRLGSCLGAWALGAAVAVPVGIFVWPRHSTGRARSALGDWFEAASSLAEALGTQEGVTERLGALEDATAPLEQVMVSVGNRPSWRYRQTRLLLEVLSEAQASTRALRSMLASAPSQPLLDVELARATAAAFDWCAATAGTP